MLIEIPATAIEIQPGLWADRKTVTFGSITIVKYDLYSAEGYCFYDLTAFENYDEEGNLKPENERLYYRVMYTPYSTVEQINADIVSVPIQEGYEILSTGGNNDHVTA